VFSVQTNPDGQTDGTTVEVLQKNPAGQGRPEDMPDEWQEEMLRDTDVAFPAQTFPGTQA
jgi:hypothetical protein